jgi:hypothetical protein
MSDAPIALIEVEKKPQEYPLIPINPLDFPVEVFSEAINRRLNNTKLVTKIVKANLKEGIHYGSIPLKKGGKTRPTLFKPGGEQIISLLGLKAHWPSYSKYEEAVLNGITIDLIILRCELLDGLGRIVSEGISGRYLSTDYNDANKALKMASKSSMLSAVLNLGFSSLFTVDLDDEYSRKSAEQSVDESKVKTITSQQLEELNVLINSLGLDQSRVEAYCKRIASAKGLVVNALSDLPLELFDFVTSKLPAMAEQKVQAIAA